MWITESLGLEVTSAQSRSSNKVTPGCWGLYPVRSWTFLSLGTVKPLWADLWHCLTALMGKKVFSSVQFEPPVFQLNIIAFILPPCTFVKSLAPSYWGSHRFSRLNKPWSCSILSQGRGSSPWPSQWTSAELSWSCIGGSKLDMWVCMHVHVA